MNKPTEQSQGTPVKSALIVDDEPLILSFLSDTLQDMGFKVTESNTATEAIRAASADPDFCVAFVDLGLPDISGLELIAELRKTRPDLPIIIASGYGVMAKRDLDESDASSFPILSKPYNAKSIAEILNDIGM